jgi:hypothetical protein
MLEEYYGNVGNVGLSVTNIKRPFVRMGYRGFNWNELSPNMLR